LTFTDVTSVLVNSKSIGTFQLYRAHQKLTSRLHNYLIRSAGQLTLCLCPEKVGVALATTVDEALTAVCPVFIVVHGHGCLTWPSIHGVLALVWYLRVDTPG